MKQTFTQHQIFTHHLDAHYVRSKDIKKFNPDIIPDDTIVYFWYDQLDRVVHKVPFTKFLTEEQWNLLKEKPEQYRIIFCYCGDYVNSVDLKEFIDEFSQHNLRNVSITFMAADDIFKEFVEFTFLHYGFHNIKIHTVPYMLLSTKEQNQNIDIKKRFSVFTRNFRDERLFLYAKLQEKDLLKYANYSYHFRNPYLNITYSKDEMIKSVNNFLARYRYNTTTEEQQLISNFIDSGPYELKNTFKLEGQDIEYSNKWSPLVDNNLRESYFNLIVESHYDHTNPIFRYDSKYSYTQFSPTFITEKTYKAIMCERPFLFFGGAYGLQQLRRMGFKTFSPIIPENYDSCENDIKRMKMIVHEIEKLCAMSDEKIEQVYNSCLDIVKHNKEVLLKKQKEFTTEDWWPDLHKDFNYKFEMDIHKRLLS